MAAVTRATRGNVHDVVIGRRLLEKSPPSELYADKAYDDKKFYKIAFKHDYAPCMQQRKNAASTRGIRGRVWHLYKDRKRKKYRGRVEAPFGGFANRYASRINEQLTSTRRRTCELWTLAHNIRTLAQHYLWNILACKPIT